MSGKRTYDTSTYVEIMVKLPDLEIFDAGGEFRRSSQKECLKPPAESLKKLVGVRIGPGLLKIVKGLIGETSECRQLAFMVEECCHGVILSFTKDELLKAPGDKERSKDYYADMVRENIRLYNRCAAFAPGSPLVEGVEAP